MEGYLQEPKMINTKITRHQLGTFTDRLEHIEYFIIVKCAESSCSIFIPYKDHNFLQFRGGAGGGAGPLVGAMTLDP